MKKVLVVCLAILLCLLCFTGCGKQKNNAAELVNTQDITEDIPDRLNGLRIISRDSVIDYIADDIVGVETVEMTSYLAYDEDTLVMYQIFINSSGGMSVIQLVNNDGTPKLYNP